MVEIKKQGWKRISNSLESIYLIGAWISAGLLILLCGLIIYSILARLLGWYAGGATDFAGYVMGGSTFLALAYTFRQNSHIRILLFIQKTYGPLRVLLERFGLGIMSLVTAYLAFYLTRMVVDSFEFGERSEGADAILIWIPQAPMAFGAFIFAIAVLHSFVECLISPDTYGHSKPHKMEQEEA